MLKIGSSVLLCSLMGTVLADDLGIGFIDRTVHLQSSDSVLNENHHGLYLRYKRLRIGEYRNSYNMQSNLLNYELSEHSNYSTFAGIADGYPQNRHLGEYRMMFGVRVRLGFLRLLITPAFIASSYEF